MVDYNNEERILKLEKGVRDLKETLAATLSNLIQVMEVIQVLETRVSDLDGKGPVKEEDVF